MAETHAEWHLKRIEEERKQGRKEGRKEGRKDGRTDGRTDRQTDRQTDRNTLYKNGSLFVLLVFNGTFSTNRLYCAIDI